jgi:hypothetical protein
VPRIFVGDGSNYANLADRCNDFEEDYQRVARQVSESTAELVRTLHPQVMSLVDDALEARSQQGEAWMDLMAAELGRHLPGLAPMIMLLWEHVRSIHPRNVGHCCAGERTYESGQDDAELASQELPAEQLDG